MNRSEALFRAPAARSGRRRTMLGALLVLVGWSAAAQAGSFEVDVVRNVVPRPGMELAATTCTGHELDARFGCGERETGRLESSTLFGDRRLRLHSRLGWGAPAPAGQVPVAQRHGAVLELGGAIGWNLSLDSSVERRNADLNGRSSERLMGFGLTASRGPSLLSLRSEQIVLLEHERISRQTLRFAFQPHLAGGPGRAWFALQAQNVLKLAGEDAFAPGPQAWLPSRPDRGIGIERLTAEAGWREGRHETRLSATAAIVDRLAADERRLERHLTWNQVLHTAERAWRGSVTAGWRGEDRPSYSGMIEADFGPEWFGIGRLGGRVGYSCEPVGWSLLHRANAELRGRLTALPVLPRRLGKPFVEVGLGVGVRRDSAEVRRPAEAAAVHGRMTGGWRF